MRRHLEALGPRRRAEGLPKYLTQRQVRTLFALIRSKRDRALFLVTYAYGLRVGEIVMLDRDDVDFETARIRIRRLKGGMNGEKPIFRNLVRPLRSYLRSRTDDDPALFVGRRGRLHVRRIQRLFAGYARRAGFPASHHHPHVLRHSTAVHVLDAGEHVDVVKDLLGHKSIQSTMVYAAISDRRRSETIKRLECSPSFVLP